MLPTTFPEIRNEETPDRRKFTRMLELALPYMVKG